jgi:hypothetical protein
MGVMRGLIAPALATGLALMAGRAVATELLWATGWDKFTEPLNTSTSLVHFSLSPENPFLSVTYQLNGAAPNKLYQVGIHLENCRKTIPSFGQFPALGPCGAITRQGVTRTVEAFEFGVVLTDGFGNGSFAIIVGPIAAGTYTLQFNVRNGAGCNVTGGGGSGGAFCEVDFQAPNHFAKTITLKVP